jgi:uncharacterized protein (DUF4415 family)
MKRKGENSMSDETNFDKESPEITSAEGFRRIKDDHPEWAEALKRPGRPVSENPKQPVSIRLDADVLAWLKSEGRGWQTRLNDILRREMRGE